MTEFDPTLNELVRIQQSFDIENFSGADTLDGKRTHVVLHLGKLMGKYAGIEEQADHGSVDESLLASEIAPDLLVYAAQLTEYTGGNLHQRYTRHVWGDWRGSMFSEEGVDYMAQLQQYPDDNSYRDNGLDSHDKQRRSIYFDLHQPVAALAAIESKRLFQFGDIDSIRNDITPRLVRSAIQIANLTGISLANAYKGRLEFVAERNGTGIESVHRALSVADIDHQAAKTELTHIQESQLSQLLEGIEDPAEIESITSRYKRRMARKNRYTQSRI